MNNYVEALEIEIQPAIMPTVNWSGISNLFRSNGLEDPIKRLDRNGVKTTDPNSLSVAFDTAEHTYLGFIIICPNEMLSLLFQHRLSIDVIEKTGSRYILLISGTVIQWIYAVRLGCQPDHAERLLFNAVFEFFELTTIKKQLLPYTKKILPDRSFYLV